MELPEYPRSLPQKPLLEAYSEKIPSTLKTVTPGSKMPIVRRSSSRMVTPLGVSFVLTKDELSIFEEFFYDTLTQGARRFTFTHPRKSTPIECSIVPQGDIMVDIQPFSNTLSYEISFLLWVWQ